MSDREQIGAERPPTRIESLGGVPERHEHVLDDVVGEVVVVQHPTRDCFDCASVGHEDSFQGMFMPGGDAGNELVVAR
jgi:hypothetical protein